MPLHRVPAAGAVATVLLLATTAVACTGDDEPDRAAETPSPSAAAPEAVPVEVRIGKVAGGLGAKTRKRLARKLAVPLQRYADNALLGDYPRSSFSDAFASFSKGARKEAKRDRGLLTGAEFADAGSVTARDLGATVAVFAPRGRVAGATARIRFVLEVDGQPVTVAGRLLLTPVKGRWRIFGYDVHRSGLKEVAG